MHVDLEERFVERWEADSSPPDLIEFISTHHCTDKTTILALVEIDQEFRSATDQTLPITYYVEKLPALTGGEEESIALALKHFNDRRDAGEAVDVDEYVSQFGTLRQTLQFLLQKLDDLPTGRSPLDTQKTQTHINTELVREEWIGRYRLIRVLGRGAFGQVYLGFDTELRRQVAIKVPTAERFQASEDAESYLAEARTVARLDHPHIVPVYDVGKTDDGSVYVVSKFIEGMNLKERLSQQAVDDDTIARWLTTVATALAHAHQQHIVHRDVKPANILIEEHSGEAFLADFGLAMRDDDFLALGSTAGTPAYMSPEQARGEGHRLDGRSDVFALGVVMYEMLTEERPFRGTTPNELLHQVVSVEPDQPKSIKSEIPAELERICLKALEKRAGDRFPSAAEMAQDLQSWNSSSLPTRTQRIIPKGLRSFGKEDADFFLDLLPGPQDRLGLPECVRFWKSKIEQRDPDQTFTVGLLFGPSGCGKSSLLKAGLIPQLEQSVDAMYVEATADETEIRVLRALRKNCAELPPDLGLADALAHMRKRADGRKRVIVIDQLEQWLHVNDITPDDELVRALRQADGAHVQVLLSVRDDFGMAATRLMHMLDIAIVQGDNFATVDLFDLQHAAKVFTKYGQAFGKLPAEGSFTDAQREFVTAVVNGVAQDQRVVSVQLALFADMVKGKTWEIDTLKQVGGAQGIGVNFLEESIGSRAVNPMHRSHESAARGVLQALLPELGADIKGHMRSHDELLNAAGYQNQPERFLELLRILDGELRLLTPTDPAGLQSDAGSDQLKYYQLTHDYLVQPLREWLTQKQMQTRRGRAELRLNERASLWNAQPERRYLPSLTEFIGFVTLTRSAKWNQPTRDMLRASTRLYGFYTAVSLLCIAVVGWTAGQYLSRTRARSLVEDGLLTSSVADYPSVVSKIDPHLDNVRPLIEAELETAKDPFARAKLALTLIADDHDRYLPIVDEWLLNAETPEDLEIPLDLLLQRLEFTSSETGAEDDSLSRQDLQARYWQHAQTSQNSFNTQLRAACVLARLDPTNEKWGTVARNVTTQLVTEQPMYVEDWSRLLVPVADHLRPELVRLVRSDGTTALQRQLAVTVGANILSREDPQALMDLLVVADPSEFEILYRALEPHAESAGELAQRMVEEVDREGDERLLKARMAGLLLARLDMKSFPWQRLDYCADQSLRSELIHGFARFAVRQEGLMHGYMRSQDPGVKSAILLSLGEYEEPILEQQLREELLTKIAEDFKEDPDPGLHAAARWLLSRWHNDDKLASVESDLRLNAQAIDTQLANDKRDSLGWFVNNEGLTFSYGPLELSPEDEDETSEEILLAVATHEVTRQQWLNFSRVNEGAVPGDHEALFERLPRMDCPMAGVTWFEAVRYCNWLSSQDGIPESQWCYLPNDDGNYESGLRVKKDYRELSGYRLPTVAEWTAATRANTTTQRNYGDRDDLLAEYAWCSLSSEGRAWPIGTLKPNSWGMFDMLGNAIEWCHRDNLTTESEEATSVAIRSETRQPMCGGAYSNPAHEVTPLHPFTTLVSSRNMSIGLRPVRTLRNAK